jgi:ornithine cyclodeaminase
MKEHGFTIETTRETADILNTCNLVVTTTPSTSPLLQLTDIPNGVHITAVGSDTPDKQELDVAILKRADVVAADSISQCLQRGEIYQAVKTGLHPEKLMELGNIIEGLSPGRISDQQITVADMTGVAVQDIKIAEAVYRGRKGA